MQFSATIVAIFASVAFAAAPMPALMAGADAATATPMAGAAGAMPAIPPQVQECASKCGSKKSPIAAAKCIEEACADVLKAIQAAKDNGPTAAVAGAAPAAM